MVGQSCCSAGNGGVAAPPYQLWQPPDAALDVEQQAGEKVDVGTAHGPRSISAAGKYTAFKLAQRMLEFNQSSTQENKSWKSPKRSMSGSFHAGTTCIAFMPGATTCISSSLQD